MRTKTSSLFILLLTAGVAQAQVALNTTGANPDNSAMLDVTSTTKGMLIPRMTTAQRTAIASPATGLLVYDTNLNMFHFYNGSAWTALNTPNTAWGLAGNSGTTSGTHFIGTTDNQAFDVRTNNTIRFRVGVKGNLEVLGTGFSTYLGEQAGINDDLTTRNNTAIGYYALNTNVSAANNTAVGYQALRNSTGANNTAAGYQAMLSTTTGANNVALGYNAMQNGTTGSYNIAVGAQALSGANTASNNLALGYNTLPINTSGGYNVAMGANSLTANTMGTGNVGLGSEALITNTTGNYNIAIGYQADVTVGNLTNAIAIGYGAKVSQSNTLVLGGTGANAVNVGIGTGSPLSTLEVTGTVAIKVKGSQTAGTNNPDNTAGIWVYSTGTGTITLPTASGCPNRQYVIVNQTGATRTISSYTNLAGTAQTTIATATSITIVSNGSIWLRIM